MEIEPFVFHIVGVRDSLLVKINDKLGLRLKEEEVNMKSIGNKLNQLNEQNLLTDLGNLDSDNCFQILKKLRNQSTHRTLINVQFRHEIGTGGSDEPKVFFVADPDKRLEVIPFLETSLQKVKLLLQTIIKNDPRLK